MSAPYSPKQLRRTRSSVWGNNDLRPIAFQSRYALLHAPSPATAYASAPATAHASALAIAHVRPPGPASAPVKQVVTPGSTGYKQRPCELLVSLTGLSQRVGNKRKGLYT